MTNFPKVDPNGMTARVLLAFLATAGLYYVNIMPALVDGLKEGLAFSNRDAGLVGSFNVYGAACGAFLAAFMVTRINWRIASHLLLLGLLALDAGSMFVVDPAGLMALRFVHGFVGGSLVGVGFSIIARTQAPDRTFGMLLLVQALAGGLGVMALPLLVPHFGTRVLFAALMLFTAVTLLLLQFLPDYPSRRMPTPEASAGVSINAGLNVRGPFLFALASVFLFQAANMGLYAFVIGLGKSHGMNVEFVSETLGAANWFGILGAVLVIWLSTRHGIFRPILVGMVLTVLGTWALSSDVKWVWIAANIVTAVTWNFVIAYLLGMCSRFDYSGQSAVWAGFASKMGLATGPMIGSFVLGGGRYAVLIAVALGLLALSTLAAVFPARYLDREDPRPGAA
jgi:predicted MFS family arabinose efflux permease